MEIEFDLEAVKIVEFGVGRDGENERIFVTVPVDDSVQKVLKEMVHATLDRMKKDENGPSEYQPSEKHGALEWLYLPLTNELCLDLRVLHAANNMDMDAGALSSPSDVFCYFARMVDARGRRLTALRRASQFKSVVKKKGWLIRWVDDSLRSVKDDIFKLDADFDFIIDQRNVHIIRPSGFEFAGRLQSAVCASVSRNVAEIQEALPFVDFDCIERYAVGHVRAARYLASIRSYVMKRGLLSLRWVRGWKSLLVTKLGFCKFLIVVVIPWNWLLTDLKNLSLPVESLLDKPVSILKAPSFLVSHRSSLVG